MKGFLRFLLFVLTGAAIVIFILKALEKEQPGEEEMEAEE